MIFLAIGDKYYPTFNLFRLSTIQVTMIDSRPGPERSKHNWWVPSIRQSYLINTVKTLHTYIYYTYEPLIQKKEANYS